MLCLWEVIHGKSAVLIHVPYPCTCNCCSQVYYYPGFHAPRDGPKFHDELVRNLTRPTAWEAVMRIRCSKGLHISNFHGHFFNRSTDLLALPTCDPDKTFAVQIAHEETMVSGPVGYVQCALLYTSSNGERRIRYGSSRFIEWRTGNCMHI